MPHVNYDHIVAEIKKLNITDQLRLLEETAVLIRRKTTATRKRSILELQGKGKQIWEGVDVKRYIEGERSSWNG